MRKSFWAFLPPVLLGLASPALLTAQISHPECTFFGLQRGRTKPRALSANTVQVSKAIGGKAGTRAARKSAANYNAGSIDAFIFADLETNGIAPAPPTTDWEFIRRVTLDFTGRIPAPERVLSFVADTAPDKRARLIDELLASPAWVDKWTMYLGDLYQNTANRPSTGVNRSAAGRNAFYQWIKDSLTANKPYNQMATELITPSADNNYDNGPSNWLIGGAVTGAVPMQDSVDQMTANVFDTFLGIGHMDCLLCHNGRGHLDSLSLWASRTTRYQAWQTSSYLSHTQAQAVANGLWALKDNTRGYTTDYALNTTTGNRPARQPFANCDSGAPCSLVTPQYMFDDDVAPSGDYRSTLAHHITGDFQFARATVNYMWEQLFGRGIVDPPDAFDPARLDPDNPPPAPWTLQPSNARLLNSLAQHFVDGGYNLKSLMREIASSDTYQLSSRYEGDWTVLWEPYFARKYVRRLWAEEIHDAITQSSGMLPEYTGGFPGTARYAMQLPDVVGLPLTDVDATRFLDGFLRGNRDDQPRRDEGSIVQALGQMNSAFVDYRTGIGSSKLISDNYELPDKDLVRTLFLAILSRYPTADEETKSLSAFSADGVARYDVVQDLVWSLYNKVDFIFNY
jgi:Protein of unknown function (DUF1549)/Protein of unknown function (DUF1553)